MLSVVANKAIGLDNISASLLNIFAQLSTYSITKLINCPYAQGSSQGYGSALK